MSDWQPIETAPKTGMRILTVRGNGYVAVQRWWTCGEYSAWEDDHGDTPEGQPVHWMPLPVAP